MRCTSLRKWNYCIELFVERAGCATSKRSITRWTCASSTRCIGGFVWRRPPWILSLFDARNAATHSRALASAAAAPTTAPEYLAAGRMRCMTHEITSPVRPCPWWQWTYSELPN